MSSPSKHRVVVGLSGGVDSAVGAWLLKRAGHEVVGVFMQNWEGDDTDQYCSSRQDFLDAASVADVLGIEIEHVNFAAEYKDRVFAEFLREYEAGRTPNPDVLCNSEIKFEAFLEHAIRLGADRIATGHYARVRAAANGSVELLKGLDAQKDQSYFLHRLDQRQLAQAMFPIGELPKPEVRRIAAEIGLPVAAKRDSTGICFIGERPFREFLSRYVASRPGPVEDDRGRVVGEHVGLSFYTLGQRKGIGIGGVKTRFAARGGSAHEPWFVARKDLVRNVLVVVQGHDHPWLLSGALTADDASWVAGHAPLGTWFGAKTRYRQADASCRIVLGHRDGDGDGDGDGTAGFGGGARTGLGDGFGGAADTGLRGGAGAGPHALSLRFDAPQWAVTPGQSAVLYDGAVCLGGAVIHGSTAWPGEPGAVESRAGASDAFAALRSETAADRRAC